MKAQSQIVVKKFGGTSVGSLERIEAVADRIVEDKKAGQSPIIVVSAMSGETNRLVQMAHDINPYSRGRAYDMLLASGEQVSISLLAMALEKRGVKARPFLAYQLGIKTDRIFSKARIQSVDSDRLRSIVEAHVIPIVAGFQGVSEDNELTTLGRGGSDTTAVALASAINSEMCEIYTDVPAVCSADPRLVKRVSEIKTLCFEEMMEMASLGSKVLHFRCVEIAAKYGIKIHLRSTFERREGTWVVPEEKSMENPVVSSVTHDANTAIIKIFPVPPGNGFLVELFEGLAKKGVVVDIITQSYNEEGQRLAFSIPEDDVYQAEEIIKPLIESNVRVNILRNMAKISTIGVGMKNHPGVASRFFKVLHQNDINLHLVTTSDIKISGVVDKERLQLAAEKLHSEFSLDSED